MQCTTPKEKWKMKKDHAEWEMAQRTILVKGKDL